MALRQRCLDAARGKYSWEHQTRELLRVYLEEARQVLAEISDALERCHRGAESYLGT